MALRELITGGVQPDPALRGIFSPPSAVDAGEPGAILATFKGFGRSGLGRDRGLALAERFGMISAEQRAARGPVGAAGHGALQVGARAGFASTASMSAVAGQVAMADGAAPGGLYAQILMREYGFQLPATPSSALPHEPVVAAADVADVSTVADDVFAQTDTPTVAAAADDAASRIAALEQRIIGGFQQVGALPAEQQLATLAAAVDAGAASGHGDDAFGVLAAALVSRPLEHSAAALDDALRLAPTVVESAAAVAADVLAPISGGAPRTGLHALHGVPGAMSFTAGLDDTLRLLAKFRL